MKCQAFEGTYKREVRNPYGLYERLHGQDLREHSLVVCEVSLVLLSRSIHSIGSHP